MYCSCPLRLGESGGLVAEYSILRLLSRTLVAFEAIASEANAATTLHTLIGAREKPATVQ